MRAAAFIGLTLAVGLTAHGAAAAAPAQKAAITAPAASVAQLAERLQAAIVSGDPESIRAAAEALRRHQVFREAPAEAQAELLVVLGGALAELGRLPEAEAVSRDAARLAPQEANPWLAVMAVLQMQGDEVGMVEALTAGVAHSAQLRELMPHDSILNLFASSALDTADADGLRAALFDYGWRTEHDDWVWGPLVRTRVLQGDLSGARDVLAEISTSAVIIMLRGERLFDPLFESLDPPAPDIPTMLELELERLRVASEMTTAGPGDFYNLGEALRLRGRFEEALQVIDRGLAFEVTDDQSEDWEMVTWLWDSRARVLQALGRDDDAVLAQQRAAGRVEGSGPNVSNTINLAAERMQQGQHREALELLSRFDSPSHASAFGLMQIASVRYCAAHALAETAIADEADAYLAEHWRDAPAARLWALACRDDEDAMAELMIARLQDPKMAGDAITEFHTYLETPNLTEIDRTRGEVVRRVRARPDVRAAFDAVGHQLEIPLLSIY